MTPLQHWTFTHVIRWPHRTHTGGTIGERLVSAQPVQHGTSPGICQRALTENFLDVKSKAIIRCIEEDTFGTDALGDTSRSTVQSSPVTKELIQSRGFYILWTVMMQYTRETRLVGRCLAPTYHSIGLRLGSKGTRNDWRAVSDRKHRCDTTDEASRVICFTRRGAAYREILPTTGWSWLIDNEGWSRR